MQNIHVINAEPTFLPHLRKLHEDFPRLRIVLEHATTRAAVEAVKSLGPTVACTITAHHLALTVDDWAGQSWNFCKPVAKFPDDREALREVIREGKVEPSCVIRMYLVVLGHPRFFLGSDSAPHPSIKKSTSSPDHGCAAGIYTSPILLPLTAHLLESFGALDKLEGFVSKNGREFYKKGIVSTDGGGDIVRLRRRRAAVKGKYSLREQEVIPFWTGKDLDWEIDNQDDHMRV